MKNNKSIYFSGNILNLEILFYFSVKVLCFTLINENIQYNTKNYFGGGGGVEGTKINVLNFIFFSKFPPNLRNHLSFI